MIPMKLKSISLFITILIVLAFGSVSAKGDITYFNPQLPVLQYPVEQESPNYFYNNCGGNPSNPNCDPSTWVNNPTDCAWDVDDSIYWEAYNRHGMGLSTGSTTSISLCIIADGYDNYWGDNHTVLTTIQATKDPGITATITNNQGFNQELVRSGSQNNYSWSFCTVDLTGFPNPPAWYPLIDNSNSGTGIPVVYTLTIQNQTTHDATLTSINLWTPGTWQTSC